VVIWFKTVHIGSSTPTRCKLTTAARLYNKILCAWSLPQNLAAIVGFLACDRYSPQIRIAKCRETAFRMHRATRIADSHNVLCQSFKQRTERNSWHMSTVKIDESSTLHADNFCFMEAPGTTATTPHLVIQPRQSYL